MQRCTGFFYAQRKMEDEIERYLEDTENKKEESRVSIAEAFFMPSEWDLRKRGVKIDESSNNKAPRE